MKTKQKILRRFLVLGLHPVWIASIPTLLLGQGQMYLVPGLAIIGALAFLSGVLCAIASWLLEKINFRNKSLPGVVVGLGSVVPVFMITYMAERFFQGFSIAWDGPVQIALGFAIFHGTARPFRKQNITPKPVSAL
jgi:hypothetical protein